MVAVTTVQGGTVIIAYSMMTVYCTIKATFIDAE